MIAQNEPPVIITALWWELCLFDSAMLKPCAEPEKRNERFYHFISHLITFGVFYHFLSLLVLVIIHEKKYTATAFYLHKRRGEHHRQKRANRAPPAKGDSGKAGQRRRRPGNRSRVLRLHRHYRRRIGPFPGKLKSWAIGMKQPVYSAAIRLQLVRNSGQPFLTRAYRNISNL